MLSFKLINQEISQFLIIGLINTLISWVLFLILDLFMDYILAYTFSFILCIVSSYVLNSYFVFNQSLSLKQLFKYPVVYIIQYLVQTPSLIFFVEHLNISKMFAVLIVIIISIPITFISSKFIIKQK